MKHARGTERAFFAAAVTVLGAAIGAGGAGACGTDVDVGGSLDAGQDVDAAPVEILGQCDPCTTATECSATATCARIGGLEAFCATLCPTGTECTTLESCQSVITATDAGARACTPTAGACAPAKGPSSDAGTPLVQCGVLAGPPITAQCHSCDKFDKDCQANGCYGGWWCNTTTRRCQRPPKTC